MNKIIKKVRTMVAGTIILGMVTPVLAQQVQQVQPVRQPRAQLTVEMLKKYVDLPETQRKAENKKFLELYADLRVADVRDGMDWFGYHHYGSVDPKVRPLYRTHVVGIARTARYLPYVGPSPLERGAEYDRWQGMYYNTICTYPWMDEIEDGDFMAIDLSGVDAGLLGSENTLRGLLRGCRGYVINGAGIRDTDEVINQKVPVWSHFISQAMVQARIQFDAKNIPIAIGGVTIFPGDIIVADGDGVIVVPRSVAEEVAKQATKMISEDKATRRALYERLGWEMDHTVQ